MDDEKWELVQHQLEVFSDTIESVNRRVSVLEEATHVKQTAQVEHERHNVNLRLEILVLVLIFLELAVMLAPYFRV